MNAFTTVDVIIPTYKPGRSFRRLLKMLESQSHAPAHILIINTEEAYWDNTLTEDIPSAEVFHIKQSQFDHAGTRNMGAGFSDADVIMFMTQDAMPCDEQLIENLLQGFTEPAVKAVYARQLSSEGANLIEQYTRAFNYPARSMIKREKDLKRMGIKAYFCSNVCAAYDHAFFDAMGGFRTPAIFNEDMVFCGSALKAGQAVGYVSSAKVHHSHNYSALEQFHRNFDNGVSQAANPDIFKGVPSAGEGMKLVRKTASYLKKKGQGGQIIKLIWVSGWKFLGFRLGKSYGCLPKWLIRLCSLNKSYWDTKITVE